jgi:hypothetical protein
VHPDRLVPLAKAPQAELAGADFGVLPVHSRALILTHRDLRLLLHEECVEETEFVDAYGSFDEQEPRGTSERCS